MSERGVHSMDGRSAMLHRNLREGKEGDKNPGSANKYTEFGQLILSGKSLKYCHQMSHFKAKCTKFDSWRLSVRLFVSFLF